MKSSFVYVPRRGENRKGGRPPRSEGEGRTTTAHPLRQQETKKGKKKSCDKQKKKKKKKREGRFTKEASWIARCRRRTGKQNFFF